MKIINASIVGYNNDKRELTRILVQLDNGKNFILKNLESSNIEYNFGDNRGNKCIIDWIGTRYYHYESGTKVNLNWVQLKRYYDDENRWSTGHIRIDGNLFFDNLINYKEDEDIKNNYDYIFPIIL